MLKKRIFFFTAILTVLAACSPNAPTIQNDTSVESEDELVARALEIHDRVLTFDSHADTPLRMIEPGFDMAERHDPNESGSKVDYPRMIEGGLDAIFFAAFVAQNIRDDEGNSRAKALGLQMIDAVIASTEANSDTVGLALTPDDAYALEKEGKRAIYLAIENGYPIGDDISNIELFYNKGVRYITLVHSTNNDLADSATDSKGPEHQGISPFGEQVVLEMNRLGIMVDVSHGSEEVFYDAIAVSKAPIIASHSNARAVTAHDRNMSDDMLKLMAENGGVVQLTMLSDYLRDAPENPERDAAVAALRAGMKPFGEMNQEERKAARAAFNELNEQFPVPAANVNDVVDHIDHIVKIAGIDHVGIGCDFDGGGGIDGIFDASEVMNITIELVRRGYSEQDIEKIWSGNLMRVFRDVQRIAAEIQSSNV
ncbi:dipeptidase [Alteromonas sp. KUL49]|uniref:dipeptidase n=1 Tax=Alteromonas sp. KUL49 TaxID=2480798 RepID=UPI00102F1DA4|nr:dipeptidase [Alteromonas sp. KUL49]TAP40195.1 membrane dipeptidase [Alteromonas sp. KUL49]GEA11322.1 dipeptidase [Alteromonas sp. KUL49]